MHFLGRSSIYPSRVFSYLLIVTFLVFVTAVPDPGPEPVRWEIEEIWNRKHLDPNYDSVHPGDKVDGQNSDIDVMVTDEGVFETNPKIVHPALGKPDDMMLSDQPLEDIDSDSLITSSASTSLIWPTTLLYILLPAVVVTMYLI